MKWFNDSKEFLLRLSLPTKLSIFGVVIILLAIWGIPEYQVRSIKNDNEGKRLKIENDVRTTLVQAIGGLGLFVTGYFGFQNLKVAQENLEETRKKQTKDAEIAQKNLAATEEKQVTERFAKAIELLGNENIHVRLGAIYALERIAKDSDKDYWQIMEILTAYVREQSVLFITTDTQAVLTVITRRTKNYGQKEENYLDLSRSNLQGADLQGANLKGANLKKADLQKANLQGANLQKANLQGANLLLANLQEANLLRANLQGACPLRANLQEANLLGADLQGAKLLLANLQGAYLRGTNLQEADLQKANLLGADLQEADLQKANLRGTNLQGAKLAKVKNLTLEQLESADNWQVAHYDPEVRECLGLLPEPPENKEQSK